MKSKFHLYIVVDKKLQDVPRETNEKKIDATLSIVAYMMEQFQIERSKMGNNNI